MADRQAAAADDGKDRFRSHWWHEDYLALVAGRLGLGAAARALDLGCGRGQWAAALSPHLADGARVVGLDRDSRALASAAPAVAAFAERGQRLTRVRGDAARLPFAERGFDLVTGQTVMMHLRDPRAALAEACRVLRPGGRVLFAEPLNRLYGVSTLLAERSMPVTEQRERLETQLLVEQAMRDAGHGDLSVPERLVDDLAATGFTDLRVDQSDRVILLGADAAHSPDAAALVATIRQLAGDGVLLGSFAPLLAGCDAALRERLATGLRQEQRRYAALAERIDRGESLGLFPMHLFLVSAQRPPDQGSND